MNKQPCALVARLIVRRPYGSADIANIGLEGGKRVFKIHPIGKPLSASVVDAFDLPGERDLVAREYARSLD